MTLQLSRQNVGLVLPFGLMGRAGYEKHLKAVQTTLARTKYVING